MSPRDCHPRRLLDIAGYLALWPALYLWAVACLLADLVGLEPPGPAAAGLIITTALSVYLVDRVKLADRFADPGDAATHPARHAWLWAHRRLARSLALGAGLAAVVFGSRLHPLLALAPLAGQAAVFFYSGLPPAGHAPRPAAHAPRPAAHARLRRLKDVLIVKNLATTAGVVGLALLAALGRRFALETALARPGTILAVGLVVFGDCVLCDVGDRFGDAGHGTRTIPGLAGPAAARATAMLAAAAAVTLLMCLTHAADARSRALWLGLSEVVLVAMPADLVRNATDLRMPAVVALTWLLR